MGAHDLFFGRLFQHRDNAIELLRWLVPPQLREVLVWDTLQFERTSSRHRHARFSDLVFSVETVAGRGLRLHLLLEHQRTAQMDVPLRVTEYLVHDLLRQLQAGETLTRIAPIVVYNGKRPWNVATSVEELLPNDGLEQLLGDFQLRCQFTLLDLSSVPDETIREAALGAHVKLGLLLLKNAPSMESSHFWTRFDEWRHWLTEILDQPDGLSRLEALLDYISNVVGPPTVENLEVIVAELPELAGKRVRTWAESLVQDGIEKGIEKGTRLGARRLLSTQLEQRFGPLSPSVAKRVAEASMDQLERWATRMLDAASAEEVVADQD